MKHTITAVCYDKRGRIISKGRNSYTKTHPLQAYFAKKVGHPEQIYLHAEIAAILKAGNTPIHTMKVYKWSAKQNHFVLAKPCIICQEAIKAFGIKHVFFSNAVGNIERL